jgi:tetratricopeptide (TPR) repeat protein
MTDLHCDKLQENKEEVRIIWLDANIDQSDDSIKTKNILLELNPAAQFYTDSDQCIDDIKLIKDEQILLISSGSFAGIILPKIDQIQSIIAIFIFCVNKKQYESLKNDYDKIIGIFVDQDDLLKSIRQTLDFLEKQAMAFCLFDQKSKSSRDLSKESATFLCHQLLFHVLEQMPQNEQSKDELLQKCEEYYRFNDKELKKIDKFRKNYSHGKAIQWYTEECFLYRLLNKALRTENIELIYSFRFFIIDLCSEIKHEHSKQKTKEIFTTYRGQRISTEELDRWKNTCNNNTIISINGFFSTSRDVKISLKFARQDGPSNVLQRVLFEIEVDPSIKNIVYADISQSGKYLEEKEILFNLNSLFKIISIDWDSIDDIWKIKLKATDEGTQNVDEHLKHIQQEIDECSPIIYFGWLLLNELGQVNQAEKYFQMLLKTLSIDHEDLASAYNGIGCVYSKRNQLNLALENYQIALDMRQKRIPPNYSHIAASLHNIGGIHMVKGDFDQALRYYKQALQIEEDHQPDKHLQKAVVIQSIGNIFTEKDDFETALKHLSCAHGIFQAILPEKHHIISTCWSDIGFVYEKKGNFNTALDYYRKALEIDEYCLPIDHPYLTKDLQTIAFLYKNNKKINEAHKFCLEKLADLKKMSGNHHTRIAQILITMANVIEDEQFFQPALQYYKEALMNLEQSRPIDRRAIARCLEYIGRLHLIYGKFEQAIPKLLEALAIYRQVWPSDHSDIADICGTIARYYRETNQPLEALEYFKKSLTFYQVNYGSDHEKVKLIEDDIAKLNAEQQITTEPVITDIHNEQIIAVIIDSDPLAVIAEPSSIPAIDSTSIPDSHENETKSEPKTPIKKRKLCRNCEIL